MAEGEQVKGGEAEKVKGEGRRGWKKDSGRGDGVGMDFQIKLIN